MKGQIILIGQDGKEYSISAFGYEKNNVFCTIDKDCQDKIVIGTYASAERACEVVNDIYRSMDDRILVPQK